MATVHEQEGELSEAMDETIRTTLAEINARSAPEAQIPVEEEPPAPEVEQPEKPDRPRDEEGKFAKQKQPVKQVAKTPAAQAEPTKPEPTAVPEPAAAEPPETLKFGKVEVDLARPPSSWKPSAKAAWNALPPEVRTEIYRRETDFSNSVLNGPMKQNADFGSGIRQIIEPYRPMIESEGATPEKAIGDLMKMAALFRGSNQPAKLQTLFHLDQQFNSGLREHFRQSVEAEVRRLTGQAPQAQPQAPQVFQDPRVDSLMKAMQERERAEAAQQESMAQSATEAFISAKNEKGELKFPFVDNVAADMTERVAALRRANPARSHQEILEEAYTAAAWANPEVRQVLISQQTAPQQAAAQTALKAAAARRATVGAMPKRGAIPATEPAKSLDDSIRETGQALGMF